MQLLLLYALAMLPATLPQPRLMPGVLIVEALAQTGAVAPQGSIVYIQLDSLINQYDMFNDLRSELESKAQAIQDDLTKKGRSFESAVKDFQTKIEKGLLTRSQAEEQQQKLAQALLQDGTLVQMLKRMTNAREE